MLEVRHISFSWGRSPVLDDVSFDLAPGTVVVLAGANGAGKTTLLKILAGLCYPTAGTVSVDGVDAFLNPLRYHRMLGYLPENAPADPDMRVKGYLRYRANLRGEMAKKIRHRVAEAMEICGLESVADARIGALSQGFRKRVALADALLLRPRFLLLDDLLAGLDPATRASFGRILASLSSFAAILVSGHELDELAQWATSYLVLQNAQLYTADKIADVKDALGYAQKGSAPAPTGAGPTGGTV